MSNAIHRILSNAMLFALLVSVSFTALAHDNTDILSSPNAHYYACDIPDQANLDVDIDSHVNGFSIRAIQPLPENTLSLYVNNTLAQPFSQAYQRGPPSYLI